MQKIKSLSLVFVFMFSIGKNCVAMQRDLVLQEEQSVVITLHRNIVDAAEGQNLALSMQRERACQETRHVFMPACKRCFNDVLKIAVGTSTCLSSSMAAVILVKHFSQDVYTPALCGVSGAAGIYSGFYSIYQTIKLLQHSWDLIKTIGYRVDERQVIL